MSENQSLLSCHLGHSPKTRLAARSLASEIVTGIDAVEPVVVRGFFEVASMGADGAVTDIFGAGVLAAPGAEHPARRTQIRRNATTPLRLPISSP